MMGHAYDSEGDKRQKREWWEWLNAFDRPRTPRGKTPKKSMEAWEWPDWWAGPAPEWWLDLDASQRYHFFLFLECSGPG